MRPAIKCTLVLLMVAPSSKRRLGRRLCCGRLLVDCQPVPCVANDHRAARRRDVYRWPDLACLVCLAVVFRRFLVFSPCGRFPGRFWRVSCAHLFSLSWVLVMLSRNYPQKWPTTSCGPCKKCDDQSLSYLVGQTLGPIRWEDPRPPVSSRQPRVLAPCGVRPSRPARRSASASSAWRPVLVRAVACRLSAVSRGL